MPYGRGDRPVPKCAAVRVLSAFGRTATAGLLATLGFPAAAQDARPMPKVEITGSSIKRLNAETALPDIDTFGWHTSDLSAKDRRPCWIERRTLPDGT